MPTATSAEIRQVYRQLAIVKRPDRDPSPKVTAEMQEINEAYSILGNENKRMKYDFEHTILRQIFPKKIVIALGKTRKKLKNHPTFLNNLQKYLKLFLFHLLSSRFCLYYQAFLFHWG